MQSMQPNQVSEPAEWYLLAPSGKPTGPFTSAALIQWEAAGRIDGSTLVARRGDPAWRPIRQVSQLRHAATVSPTLAAEVVTRPVSPSTGFRFPTLIATACIFACAGAVVCYIALTRLGYQRNVRDAAASTTVERGVASRTKVASGNSAPRSGRSAATPVQEPPIDSVSATEVPEQPPPSRATLVTASSQPSPVSNAMSDQVFLARNSDNLIIWARLGDYKWMDYGTHNYWGQEIGGVDMVTPAGPNAIALVGNYINALGNVRHPKTFQEVNEPFLNDLRSMGASIPGTESDVSPTPTPAPSSKSTPPVKKANPTSGKSPR